jgi:hypothetical protein
MYTPERHGNWKTQGMTYTELSELLRVGIATEQFVVIIEVLKGGMDRVDITRRLEGMLPPTTRSGRPKPVSNMVANAVYKLAAHGFLVKSKWRMVSPDA